MLRKSVSTCVALVILIGASKGFAQNEDKEPVFSGPQVGEKLTPFKVRGVFDDVAGKDFDLVSQANGKPVAIVFVHKLTRPSVALTRAVMNYAATRSNDGLVGGVVFLSDDLTAAQTRVKRAQRALPTKSPIGISPEGQEGPGAYGLNRDVTLTVLVGKEGKVTANFALVQPSVQADAVKITKAMTDVVGGKPPTLAQLDIPRRRPTNVLGPYLRPLIAKDASKEDVAKAAKALEKFIADKPAARRQLRQTANRIVNSGRLKTYGTPAAQKYIQKWAQERENK